jgi:hypothetical protein
MQAVDMLMQNDRVVLDTNIVSNDTHYDVLKEIPFPKILVLKLKTFIERLTTSKE